MVVFTLGVLESHVSIRAQAPVEAQTPGAVEVNDAVVVDPPVNIGPLRTVQRNVSHWPTSSATPRVTDEPNTLHSSNSPKFLQFFGRRGPGVRASDCPFDTAVG